MLISNLNIRESPKFPRHMVIGVEEHERDVIFQTGSRNKAVSRMRIEKSAI